MTAKALAPQRGVALVAAIFLITVLLALGAAMVSMSSGSQDTVNKSLQAAKVYYGARAGLEWGIQRAIAAASCVAGPTAINPAQGALVGVALQVSCVQQTSHGGTNVVYYITSSATIGTLGGLDYAERRLEATVSNIP
jgi:MSHA biogenesis protein MshP